MTDTQHPHGAGADRRVHRHRLRQRQAGRRRVEIQVPADDAALVRAIGAVLRAGGEEAERLRQAMAPFAQADRQARTGAELVRFLRRSPLGGAALDIGRERGAGRSADFEA